MDALYLNGYTAANQQSFADGQHLNHGDRRGKVQQEVERNIRTYWFEQRWHYILVSIGLPIRPIPLFVIVDHFETVLRKFPDTAFVWAKSLAHEQLRTKTFPLHIRSQIRCSSPDTGKV